MYYNLLKSLKKKYSSFGTGDAFIIGMETILHQILISISGAVLIFGFMLGYVFNQIRKEN
jgi:hypothetical protein